METARTSLAALRAGNARFVAGQPVHRFAADERAAVLGGQEPRAIVVACSDARVPVEAVFDAGVGELFVIRTAGHVLTDAGLASVRFAAEKLGCRLVVVLGHEDCGAVTAALAGDTTPWLEPIVREIDVAHVDAHTAPLDADADQALLAAAVDAHVHATVELLRRFSAHFQTPVPPLIAGAAYKLSSGEVHWLDDGEVPSAQ